MEDLLIEELRKIPIFDYIVLNHPQNELSALAGVLESLAELADPNPAIYQIKEVFPLEIDEAVQVIESFLNAIFNHGGLIVRALKNWAEKLSMFIIVRIF